MLLSSEKQEPLESYALASDYQQPGQSWVKTQVSNGDEKSEAPIAIEGHQFFIFFDALKLRKNKTIRARCFSIGLSATRLVLG
jgi:hypothetical protein